MVINIGLESPQNQAAEVFNKQLDASASIVIALQVNILSSSLCERSDEIIIIIIIIIIVIVMQVNIVPSSLSKEVDHFDLGCFFTSIKVNRNTSTSIQFRVCFY